MTKTLESLVGATMILAALLLFLGGMLLRWLGSPYGGGWIEEITIYLVAWGLLLSAASAVATNDHVRADFFLRMIGSKAHHAADILAAVAGMAFCLAMAWFGWEVIEFSLRWDERGPSILQIPTAYYYAALPVSMAFCALRYLAKIVGYIRSPMESGR